MINTTSLAYMGDAVYEVAVRRKLIDDGFENVRKLHKEAVKYVSAEGQSAALKAMTDGFLTEDELKLVKRARNHKTSSMPRNADPRKYKLATGFEALIGYLYLYGDEARLQEVISKAIDIIGNENGTDGNGAVDIPGNENGGTDE